MSYEGDSCHMNCPICNAPLHELELDLQKVSHCVICGVSVFEDGGINRITSSTATYLSQNKMPNSQETMRIEPAVKLCPRDSTPLQALINHEAIPSHVNLLTCPLCHMVFAKPQELTEFKRAQEAKISYLKSWHMPMPQLKSVFAVVALALMSVFGYLSYASVQDSAHFQAEAAQAVSHVQVLSTGRLVIISFSTKRPVKSTLIIIQPAGRGSIPISSKVATTHTASFSRPTNATTLRYRIRLTDEQGRSVLSDEQVASLQTR